MDCRGPGPPRHPARSAMPATLSARRALAQEQRRGKQRERGIERHDERRAGGGTRQPANMKQRLKRTTPVAPIRRRPIHWRAAGGESAFHRERDEQQRDDASDERHSAAIAGAISGEATRRRRTRHPSSSASRRARRRRRRTPGDWPPSAPVNGARPARARRAPRTRWRAAASTSGPQRDGPVKNFAPHRRGREDEQRVADQRDGDLRRAEDEALREHAAARRIDELREQRELEHRDLRVEDRRHESLAVEPARRHRVRSPRARRRGPARATSSTRATRGRRPRCGSCRTRRHRRQQRGEAERRRQHVQQEAARRSRQRHEARRASLRQRARHEVQHVRPGVAMSAAHAATNTSQVASGITELAISTAERRRLAAADAERRDAALVPALAQRAEQRDDDARARRADRMAVSAHAPPWTLTRSWAACAPASPPSRHGERLVDLEEVDVLRGPAGLREQLLDGTDRARSRTTRAPARAWRARRPRRAARGRAVRRRAAHQHQRRGAVRRSSSSWRRSRCRPCGTRA